MPDPRNAWKTDIPKTINKSDKRPNNRHKTTGKHTDHDNDNHTTTTVNTQSSYTQDTISELQYNSYQHQQLLDNHTRRIETLTATISTHQQAQQTVLEHTDRLDTLDTIYQTHNQRMDSIDEYVRTQLSTFTYNLAHLEEEQQVQQRQQNQMARDIETSSSQLPTILENMEKQQKQLLKYFRKQNKINAQTNDELNKLRRTQATHQEMISTLHTLVLSLQNSTPSTTQSQQRIRKRIKPRPPNDISIREDSGIESEDQGEELHKMHAIASLQDHSINQLSFIDHPSMDVSAIKDDLPAWDDFSTSTEEPDQNLSLDTQNQENHHDVPGHPKPGNCT
jgi:hypothetical protein